MVIATCLAAWASWNSYVATDEASRIARAAFDFSLKTTQDASDLQRPMLTVLGGRIVEGDSEIDSFSGAKIGHFRVELHVRNSGARDASPAWVALATDILGSSVTNISDLPKDQEVTVYIDLKADEKVMERSQAVAVATRFIDISPKYSAEVPERGQSWAAKPTGFTKSCGRPVVQILTIHPISTESGRHEDILSMGPSVPEAQIRDKGVWTKDLGVARDAWEVTVQASEQDPLCQLALKG